MGMVVRSNIMAMNANRSLGMNNSQVSKNLEKLSSGYRINRAGDDASGLAISEKMKAQIKGLETASANSQDGISLVQTAEGALTEVHNMLNRMVELAGKAANGTMDNTIDRNALQEEVNSLKAEINRISEGTDFNGIKLLDGSLGGGTTGAAGVPAISGLELEDVAATKGTFKGANFAALAGAPTDGHKISMTVNYTDANGKAQVAKVALTYNDTDNVFVAEDGTTYDVADTDGKATKVELQEAFLAELNKTDLAKDFKVTASGDTIQYDSRTAGAATKIDSILSQYTPALAPTETLQTLATNTAGTDAYQAFDFAGGDYTLGDVFTIGGQKFAFVGTQEEAVALGSGVNAVVIAAGAGGAVAQADVEDMQDLIEQKTGYKPAIDATTTQLNFTAPTGAAAGAAGKGLVLQVGDTAAPFNKVTVSIGDMSVKGLGITGLSVATQDDASAALELLRGNLATGGSVRGAINLVSDNRAALGALQNRLEYTINNLDVAAENLSAANSRIRDTDMAKQMMEYTKTNVLTQAAQAMLAQANQQPQSILQLLQ